MKCLSKINKGPTKTAAINMQWVSDSIHLWKWNKIQHFSYAVVMSVAQLGC